MNCAERMKLLRAYRDVAAIYAESVNQMVDFVEAGLEPEAQAARRFARSHWETLETLRLALYRHEADHCCDRTSELAEEEMSEPAEPAQA